MLVTVLASDSNEGALLWSSQNCLVPESIDNKREERACECERCVNMCVSVCMQGKSW